MLVAQHYIPILEIKDPGDHGPLILKPMFVGIFEQVVVLSELDNQFPFPLCLSIPFRLFWPTFPAPFATSDGRWPLTFLQQTKLLPMKPYLLFAFLMAGRKSDPFI